MSHAHNHRILGFETRNQPLLSRREFVWRLARNFLAASLVIGVSLLIGMMGYWHFEEMT